MGAFKVIIWFLALVFNIIFFRKQYVLQKKKCHISEKEAKILLYTFKKWPWRKKNRSVFLAPSSYICVCAHNEQALTSKPKYSRVYSCLQCFIANIKVIVSPGKEESISLISFFKIGLYYLAHVVIFLKQMFSSILHSKIIHCMVLRNVRYFHFCYM